MQLEAKKYLYDIQQAAGLAADFTSSTPPSQRKRDNSSTS